MCNDARTRKRLFVAGLSRVYDKLVLIDKVLFALVKRRIERVKERKEKERQRRKKKKTYRDGKRQNRKSGIPRTTGTISWIKLNAASFSLLFFVLISVQNLSAKIAWPGRGFPCRSHARHGLSFKPDARHRGESRVINYVLLLL